MKPPHIALTLLNGMTPQQFLTEYWQKKPLLIRDAIPAFQGLLDQNELAGLACEPDVQARLIRHMPKAKKAAEQWQVVNGPFDEQDFAALPAKDWTLLVQGVNHYLPEAQDLLQQFNFIPNARLDDLMVSYAPAGGGVGPHIDSYDVFLLQGAGKRRWRISQQTDLSLMPEVPLRLLSNFVTEQEWVLEAGDMLYLPPHVAHWGLAEDDACMTYSIGFRAPATRELAVEFLEHCRQQGMADTRYADPDLQVAEDPSAVDDYMVNTVQRMLQQMEWSPSLLGPFLARYFSEPKAHVVFEPRKKMRLEKFVQRLKQSGLVLSLQSQILHWQTHYFINGDSVNLPASAQPFLHQLAVQRQLNVETCQQIEATELLAWLCDLYVCGYADFA